MTPRKSVILNEVKNLVIGAIVFLPSLLSADPSTTLRSAQDDKERARAHCGSAQRPTRGYNHEGVVVAFVHCPSIHFSYGNGRMDRCLLLIYQVYYRLCTLIPQLLGNLAITLALPENSLNSP